MKSPALSPAFVEAFAFVAQRYAGKVRGNTGVPAIAHAMAVTALVLDLGGDETQATAALLHDVAEDAVSDGPESGREMVALIEARWGSAVAGLVEELSDELEPSERSWPERKAAYLESMPRSSPASLRISLADKVDNTRTLLRGFVEEGDALFVRHTAGDRETFLWYYESLVGQFEARRDDLGPGARPMLLELGRVVELLRTASG